MYSQNRWNTMRRFIAHWYPPLMQEDGIPSTELDEAENRLGLKLPTALRDWYMLAGGREDISAAQNYLLRPSELSIVDHHLVFYVESQRVVGWGIPLTSLERSDPSVELDTGYLASQHGWVQENTLFSDFMRQMVIHQSLFTGDFRGNASLGPTVTRKIEATFPYLNLPSWHWPIYPTQFFGDDDVILVTNDDSWLWIKAHNQVAFRKLLAQLNIEWEYLSETRV